jgi:SpoVK/Ycf46/Vps4 family AAA+-type ATPase
MNFFWDAEAVFICVSLLKLTEYELCIASNLVDPLSMVTDWDDIGGLAETIQEIKETIIMPFQHHSLFVGSGLVQPPKGFTVIYSFMLIARSLLPDLPKCLLLH